MTTVFISYSHKDITFAKKLSGSLAEIGFESWVDWNDIPPTADWWEQIEKGVEASDAFLFLISPASISSDICAREVEHALKNGKRIVPVVLQDVNQNDVSAPISKLNWVFFRAKDDFDVSLRKLELGLKIDLGWVEAHRRLQVLALDWQKQKDNSLLLRGKDLQDVELQFTVHGSKDPLPTDLQREYVLVSRQTVEKQRKIVTGISVAGGLIMAALAIFGFFQANQASTQATLAMAAEARANSSASIALTAQAQAEQQAEKALAGSLAAQADSIKGRDHTLALLLGMEAYQRENNLLTRTNLFQLLQFSPYTRLFEYSGQVSSIAVSPDGKWIAASSTDQINIIDSGTRSSVYTITPADSVEGLGFISSLAFNNDGSLLAAAGCVPGGCQSQSQLTLWDMTNPARPMLISDIQNGHSAQIKTIAFSPDGKYLASGSYDDTIILWDISEPGNLSMIGSPLQDPSHRSDVISITFSPDGKTLASSREDYSIQLWDVSTPKTAALIGSAPDQHSGAIYSIAFSPLESGKFASASDDNTVVLWDWDSNSHTLNNPQVLEGHNGFVRSVAFNADGTMLASAGFDSTVFLWNVKTGERIGSALSAHTKAINAIAFGTAGLQDVLLSASSDRTIIFWDLSTHQPVNHPIKDMEPPAEIGKAANNSEVEASVEGRQISITGRSEPLVDRHTGLVNSLDINSQKIDDKILLVSASDDQTVILWDITNPAEADIFLKLEGFNGPVKSAFFSTDGKQMTTIESNGHTTLWNIDPIHWLELACKAVGRNLTQDEWQRYLSGEEYHQTCPDYP